MMNSLSGMTMATIKNFYQLWRRQRMATMMMSSLITTMTNLSLLRTTETQWSSVGGSEWWRRGQWEWQPTIGHWGSRGGPTTTTRHICLMQQSAIWKGAGGEGEEAVAVAITMKRTLAAVIGWWHRWWRLLLPLIQRCWSAQQQQTMIQQGQW